MRLFSTLAVQGPLEAEILGAWAEETGTAVDTTFDPTGVLLRRIEAGERPDVLIALAPELRRPELAGVVDADLAVPVVRTGVALAVLGGAEAPPIGTVDELVATLTGARSVAYSRTGASGLYFARLIDELGIADRVDARATVVEKGFTANALLDGRADLAVQQLSELLTITGVDVVGPLPEPVQHYSTFAAAPGPHPRAVALTRFLAAERTRDAYARFGLEPVPGDGTGP